VKYIAESTLTISTSGTLVASGYCSTFLYIVVRGRFPSKTVLGRVTWRRIFARDITTYSQKVLQSSALCILYKNSIVGSINEIVVIHTAMSKPYSTDENMTPKNAPMHARKSSLSTYQIR